MLYSPAMQLNTWLKAQPGRIARLARAIGCTPSFISQIRAGPGASRRPVPAALCPRIEVETSFEVRRWEMRPDDWHLIWPELVGTEGAPSTPTERVEQGSPGHGVHIELTANQVHTPHPEPCPPPEPTPEGVQDAAPCSRAAA